MKTKFKFNLGGCTINREVNRIVDEKGQIEIQSVPMEIPAIEVEGEVEYKASEILELWNAYKVIADEAPEVLGKFAVALVEAYYEADRKVAPLHEEAKNECC